MPCRDHIEAAIGLPLLRSRRDYYSLRGVPLRLPELASLERREAVA